MFVTCSDWKAIISCAEEICTSGDEMEKVTESRPKVRMW